MSKLDLLLITPSSRKESYQGLSDMAAIEPPVWTGLMATFIRNKGYSVQIIDAEAEDIGAADVAKKVKEINPVLTTIVVFGHQPSASTQTMAGGSLVSDAIKELDPSQKVLFVGGHVSALPGQTMNEEKADFVCNGEGPHTIKGLIDALKANKPEDFAKVPGLWYREKDEVKFNEPAPLIDDLDKELPGVAWDLLPMKKYRAHNWHCFGHPDKRSPYASIYTSLGCPFKCSFCCINAPFGKPSYRYRSPKIVVDEIEFLVKNYGVYNIKILDEMFVLNNAHVEAICDGIIERGLKVNIWAYSRIDTIKAHILAKLKKAGINWVALGIESSSSFVRDGVSKSFGRHDINQVVKMIQDAGIYIIGNYIFGLPDDNFDTMQETLDMAMEQNCEFANFYSAMAYPGSKLYNLAIEEGWELPDTWSGYAQHAKNAKPLRTRHISAAEVIGFRDQAFKTYYTNPKYLKMIREKFGQATVDHINHMNSFKLERQLEPAGK